MASQVVLVVKILPVDAEDNARDVGSIPGIGRSPRKGNGNPLQYSCLENPMDKEVWWVTFHGVAKSWTRLSDFLFFLLSCMVLHSLLHANSLNKQLANLFH